MEKCIFGRYADSDGPDQTAHAQSDQGHHCPIKELLDAVKYILTNTEGADETGYMRRVIWAFALHQCPEGPFSHAVAQL